MVLAASALRTGTALRPRPGSNAIRIPRAAVSEPAWAAAVASRDGRAGAAGPPGRAGRATRQATGTSRASGAMTATASPAARSAGSTCTPGLGSACRAAPTGIRGEAATATPTAISPPPAVTAAARARDKPSSWALTMPSARSTGNSAASRMSWRPMSGLTTMSVNSAASAANSARATAAGRMARCAAARCGARFTKLSRPADG